MQEKAAFFDPVFTDNLILQRGGARVYGRGESPFVRLRYRQCSVETRMIEGRWLAELPCHEAVAEGSDLILEVSEDGQEFSEASRLKNVRVGEVWLCSGQSNMEIPLSYICNKFPDALSQYNQADNWENISVFQVGFAEASEPKKEAAASGWFIPKSAEDVLGVSSFATAFAVHLEKLMHVPVGIFVSTVGGSNIEEWLSRESFLYVNSTSNGKDKIDSRFYNAMICPYLRFSIGGLLWYQGEANVCHPDLYRLQFAEYLRLYRSHFGDVPALMIQLPQFCDYVSWCAFRKMQWEMQWEQKDLAVVCGIDLGCNLSPAETAAAADGIHPADKWPFAARAAGVAAQRFYHLTVNEAGSDVPLGGSPYPIRTEKKEEKLEIVLNESVLSAEEVKGIEVCADGVWKTASAKACGDKLCVMCPRGNITRVRYLESDVFADGFPFLRNKFGLPLVPFEKKI